MDSPPETKDSASTGGAVDGEALDLEAAIAEFLGDDTRGSLELPASLTADQRKDAKRLVDRHPELKCESYGFGAERQLHVFKKDPPKPAVNVKNTFIDDWVGEAGAEESAEPIIFRSMPVNLLQRTLQRCLIETGNGPLTPLPEGRRAEEPGSAASPDSSATAGPLGSSPGSSVGLELPQLPQELKTGLKVRNTFIHIETLPVVDRIVQSMPGGMFRQCLEAELSAQQGEELEADGVAAVMPADASASASPAPALERVCRCGHTLTADSIFCGKCGTEWDSEAKLLSDVIDEYPSGTEVIIQNLSKLPTFNGLTGVVQSLDPESGRYDVLLDTATGSCGWRWVKVKGDNLRHSLPPPPRNAPTLLLDSDDIPGDSVPPTPTWEDGDISGQLAPSLKLETLV